MKKTLLSFVFILSIVWAQAQIVNCTLNVSTQVLANEPCYGDCKGSVKAVVSGGTPPYTYLWAPSGGSKDTASLLCANFYTVTVTDANACSASASCFISQPPKLTLTITSVTPASCPSCCDGAICASGGGGTPIYSFVWTPFVGTNACATGLCPGSYTVCVTDAHGCVSCSDTSVSFLAGVNNLSVNDINYSVNPNPSNGRFTVNISSSDIKECSIEVYNILGEQISSTTITSSSPGLHSKEIDISPHGKGVYFIALKYKSRITMKKIVVF